MLRQDEIEDGRVDATDCIRPFYPKIIILYVLDTMGNLVFSLLLMPINKTLEGCDSLSFLLTSFLFLRFKRVSYVLDFYFNN
jgi:hypothetical protein